MKAKVGACIIAGQEFPKPREIRLVKYETCVAVQINGINAFILRDGSRSVEVCKLADWRYFCQHTDFATLGERVWMDHGKTRHHGEEKC
jgi:hypothetical protein